jgi:hypothetical protein
VSTAAASFGAADSSGTSKVLSSMLATIVTRSKLAVRLVEGSCKVCEAVRSNSRGGVRMSAVCLCKGGVRRSDHCPGAPVVWPPGLLLLMDSFLPLFFSHVDQLLFDILQC